MQYLVTGGCGFIGSHICEALVGKGEKVRIFDDLSTGYEDNISGFSDKVELVRADICDFDAVSRAMKNVDRVFHYAAMVSAFDSVDRPKVCHEINITGALNVLEAAKRAGAGRIIFASSCSVYGNGPKMPKTENMARAPESPYAVSKAACEDYMSVYAKLYGIQTVSLRFFNVYGPRQDPSSEYSGVISRFVNDTAQGFATVYGDGKQTRDFVFVRDVVQANFLAMESDKAGHGEIINIGTGKQTSLLDLLDAIKDISGRPFDVFFKNSRPGDVRHSVADITLAADLLGFTPGYTMQNGLAELLDSATV